MARYDNVQQRDAVPPTEKQKQAEDRKERLMQRGLAATAGDSSVGRAQAQSNENRSPRTGRSPSRGSSSVIVKSEGPSILSLVMISLLPFLLYVSFKVVLMVLEPSQARQIEAFVTQVETQVLAWLDSVRALVTMQ